MAGGYVLNFVDRTFQEFIHDAVGIDIYAGRYRDHGSSKAKHLRCFWEKEDDATVGKLLKLMVEYGLERAEARSQFDSSGPDPKDDLNYQKSWKAVQRLLGNSTASEATETDEESFLRQTFRSVPLDSLPIEGSLIPVLKDRFFETEKCYKAGAYLAVVILSGSMLEASLLGLSQSNPRTFNQARSAPRTATGGTRPFSDWKLADFVAVAHEVGAIRRDVWKFSEHLRDFRNYIHPYQQLSTQFCPDHHTAEICLMVLKAAVSQMSQWKAGT